MGKLLLLVTLLSSPIWIHVIMYYMVQLQDYLNQPTIEDIKWLEKQGNRYGFKTRRPIGSKRVWHIRTDMYGRDHEVMTDVYGNVAKDLDARKYMEIDLKREFGNRNRKSRSMKKGVPYYCEYYYNKKGRCFAICCRETETDRAVAFGSVEEELLEECGMDTNKNYFKWYYEPQDYPDTYGNTRKDRREIVALKEGIEWMTLDEFLNRGYPTKYMGIAVPYAPSDGNSNMWNDAELD